MTSDNLMNNECHIEMHYEREEGRERKQRMGITNSAWIYQEMAFRSGLDGHFSLEKGKMVFQAEGGVFAKPFLMAREESGKLGWPSGKGCQKKLRMLDFLFLTLGSHNMHVLKKK